MGIPAEHTSMSKPGGKMSILRQQLQEQRYFWVFELFDKDGRLLGLRYLVIYVVHSPLRGHPSYNT